MVIAFTGRPNKGALVVFATLPGVTQDVVCLCDGVKPLERFWILVGVEIGMVFLRQFIVSFLDVRRTERLRRMVSNQPVIERYCQAFFSPTLKEIKTIITLVYRS